MEERIIANTHIEEGVGIMLRGEWSPCWLWIGKRKTNRNGKQYGVITTRYKKGPRKGKVRSELVHRVVLKVFKGRSLRARQVGMHLCPHTLCCAPDHLTGGTQKRNVQQTVREGRHKNAYSK